MDRIRIANMTFYGHHGVGASERELGGRFHIDVELCLGLFYALFMLFAITGLCFSPAFVTRPARRRGLPRGRG